MMIGQRLGFSSGSSFWGKNLSLCGEGVFLRWVVLGFFGASLALSSWPVMAKSLVSPEYVEELRKNTFVSTLDNGLSVVHRKTQNDVTAVNLILDWDRQDQMFLHNWDLHRQFIAELMVKQTRRYSREQMNDLVMENVGEFSCSPTPGCSNSGRLSCKMVTPRDNFHTAMDLLASVILEPKFSAKDLKVAQDRALVALRKCELNEEKQASKKLSSIVESPADWLHRYYDLAPHVQKLTVEDLHETYKSYLNGKRMYLGVVGDHDHDELVVEVKNRFGDVPSWHFVKPVLDYRNTIESPLSFHKERMVMIEKEEYPNVNVVLEPRKKFRAKNYSSYGVALTVLTYTMYEKYFEVMRVHDGLTYAPHAVPHQISFSTSKLPQAMKVTQDFLEDMRLDPLKGSSVDEYKNKIYSGFYSNYLSSLSVVKQMLSIYLTYDRMDEEFEFTQRLAAVDADAVKFLAGELLRDYKMSFLGPKKLMGDLSVYENYFDPPVIEAYP